MAVPSTTYPWKPELQGPIFQDHGKGKPIPFRPPEGRFAGRGAECGGGGSVECDASSGLEDLLLAANMSFCAQWMIDLRFTRTQRLRAGCVVALLYLLCVMTPTIALALSGMATPDCLLTDASAMVHVHNHASTEPQHHSMHSEHGAAHVHDAMVSGQDDPSSSNWPARPAHGSAGTSCCELMCLTALPAMYASVGAPDLPVSRCLQEASRVMSDNAPPRLYRPPIS